MTKRVKLMLNIKTFLQRELITTPDLSSEKVDKRIKAIESINNRLPKLTTAPQRLSSQRKLFY